MWWFLLKIFIGDDGGLSMVRSMLVKEGFVVEGTNDWADGTNLVFLGGSETKVTFFFIMEGGVIDCCEWMGFPF